MQMKTSTNANAPTLRKGRCIRLPAGARGAGSSLGAILPLVHDPFKNSRPSAPAAVSAAKFAGRSRPDAQETASPGNAPPCDQAPKGTVRGMEPVNPGRVPQYPVHGTDRGKGLDSALRNVQRKNCRSCGIVKSLWSFYRNSKCKDGHESDCKVCKRAAVSANYALKSEAIRARKRVYNRSDRAKALRAARFQRRDRESYNEARRMNYRARRMDGLPGRGRIDACP